MSITIEANCRFCGSALTEIIADLGVSPLANSFVSKEDLRKPEKFFPLVVYVCSSCFLVQLEEFEKPENIFTEYLYFSSYSESWLKHCEAFAREMIPRLALGEGSLVLEIASNDGYLLQFFQAGGVPVVGVEPASNVAKVAADKGIRTLEVFFGARSATQIKADFGAADLIVANNVLAHVPALNDFVSGLAQALKNDGIVSIEVPHLLELVRGNQFDTIYHEHFSYFSLMAVCKVMAKHRMRVFDVERLRTHGGSLRIFVCHEGSSLHRTRESVAAILLEERRAKLDTIDGYRGFGGSVSRVKRDLVRFLIDAADKGHRVAGYGAPAKGNTLLNYCGVTKDLLAFTVDRNEHKQDRFLPGTRIPIISPAKIREFKPHFLLILPWNLRDEITQQCVEIREWGGKFVCAVPELEVW